MKYAGIDLHSNNCVVSVIDEADRVCAERRVSNVLADVLMVLTGMTAAMRGTWRTCCG